MPTSAKIPDQRSDRYLGTSKWATPATPGQAGAIVAQVPEGGGCSASGGADQELGAGGLDVLGELHDHVDPWMF